MHQTNTSPFALIISSRKKLCRSSKLAAAALAVVASTSAAARGDQIAYWDFNTGSTAPTTTNSNLVAVPSIGLIGGVTSSFATGAGSNDPTQPGQAFNTLSYPAQGTGNKTAGLQFNLNTANFDVSNFTFDWRTSNSSSRWMTWQYTSNGSTWTDGGSFASDGGDTWNNSKTIDLSAIAAADNNANFGLRLVASFSPDAFLTFGPNTGYRAANIDDRAYASTSTWRFDSVALNGTYSNVAFTAGNLTWNTTSGTWDTNGTNKPWKNPSNVATAFAQAAGKGDNVTFANPGANSVVTVQASGVTPNSTAITNSSTLTFTGGAIGGTGGLVKNGAGRLILASSNTFTSANNPSSINGGVVETRASSGLGGGTVSIGNATWNSTTTAQTANNFVNLTGPVTFQTDTSLTINNALAGSGVLTKTGAATLAIGGVSANSGAVHLNAGTTRLDSMGALGGLLINGVVGPAIDINNATLVLNATGSSSNGQDVRISDNIALNNSTLSRNQLTLGLGPSPTNGDSELSAYAFGSTVGGTFTVTGNSTIANLETRTAGASDGPGSGGSNNAIDVRMPVLITSGSTLTLFAINGNISNVGGEPTGNLGNTAVALRGPDTVVNANDSVTLQAGATIVMSGAGDKRIGSSKQGKPIVARGTTASEATIKADGRTYLTDLADVDGNVNTIFVVAGSGTGGLRIEAPMNANYLPVSPTSGLFGANPDQSETTLGNIYTIVSAKRFAALSSGGPTQGVDGNAVTRSGTFTLAASDAAGATGTIDNGPATGSAIKLGLDNTAASGALVYQVDPSAAGTGANFANFNGLVLKKTGAASVTTKLLANATLNGTSPAATTLEHLGGTLDLNNKSLTVGVATLSNGTITNSASGIGTLSASTITKNTTSNFRVGPRARLNGGLNVSAGTLTFTQSGTSNSTSKVSSLTIGAAAAVDLTDNDLIIGAGTSKAQVFTYLKKGYDFGNFDGVAGLTTSLGLAGNNNTTLGLLDADEYANNNGSPTFDGYAVASTDKLVKYTYFGDVDFNGAVDSTDYNIIDFGFLTGASGWANGDVDYSGAVDSSDYNNIDFAFVSQNGALRRAISYLEGADRSTRGMGDESLQEVIKHYDEFGDAYAAGFLAHVPEPTSLGIVGLAAGALMGRRRRNASN